MVIIQEQIAQVKKLLWSYPLLSLFSIANINSENPRYQQPALWITFSCQRPQSMFPCKGITRSRTTSWSFLYTPWRRWSCHPTSSYPNIIIYHPHITLISSYIDHHQSRFPLPCTSHRLFDSVRHRDDPKHFHLTKRKSRPCPWIHQTTRICKGFAQKKAYWPGYKYYDYINKFLQILHEPIRVFPGTCLKVEVENLPIFRFTRLPRCWQPRWLWKGESWYHLNQGSWWIYQPKHHALWMGKSLKITFAMVGFPAKWVVEWSLLNYGHTKELAHSRIALWCAFVICNRYVEVPKFQVSSPCSICHLVTFITSWPIWMPRKVTEQRSFQTSSSDPKKVPVFVQILRRFATRSPRWWMKPLHWWSGG